MSTPSTHLVSRGAGAAGASRVREPLDVVVIGRSVAPHPARRHAATYRGLLRALAEQGNRVLFLERHLPRPATRSEPDQPTGGPESAGSLAPAGAPEALEAIIGVATALYGSLDELRDLCAGAVRIADLVIVGSGVPEGAAVAQWVLRTARGQVAFYDFDPPTTLASFDGEGGSSATRALIPRFDLYLSFVGGPILARLERELGAAMARPLHGSFDPGAWDLDRDRGPRRDGDHPHQWELGYSGRYRADRQPALEELLFAPARRMERGRFVVAGPPYPGRIGWPANVECLAGLSPGQRRSFYDGQRFALDVARPAARTSGFAPGLRLFEAAACGVPIISDGWRGLDSFFTVGEEILVADSASDVVRYLALVDESEAHRIGARARRRVLEQHTAAHRADQLLSYIAELRERRAVTRRRHSSDAPAVS
jgi:spore maturation protein CgeB